MACFTSTSSPRLAIDVGTSDLLHVTSPEWPTHRQTYSPISNYYLGIFPLQYPLVPNPAAVPDILSFSDPPDISPPLPSNAGLRFQEQIVHHMVTATNAADPLCTITHVYQPPLHQLHDTTPEAHFVPSPSGHPYSSATPTILHPAASPEPIEVPLSPASLPDQIQVQARVPPPSTPMTFLGFGGSSIAYAAPQAPVAVANPTADHPLYPCQCVKVDGSPCNAQVRGNNQSVREHLKEAHAFNGAARDTVTCPWACGKTLKRENLPRHIVTCHFHVKSGCVYCGTLLSRPDVQHSHARSCIVVRRRIGLRLDANASRSDTR